jgi:hypothetical protein
VWVDSRDVKEDGLVEGGDLPIREKMGKILPHHTGHTVVAACVATQQLADTVVPHCESFALELLADEGMPWCVHHVFATQAADERQVVQGRETKAKAESNGCGEVRDDMERRGRLEPAPHLVPTGSETNKILIGAVVTVQKGAETNVVDLKREHPLFLCIFFFRLFLFLSLPHHPEHFMVFMGEMGGQGRRERKSLRYAPSSNSQRPFAAPHACPCPIH